MSGCYLVGDKGAVLAVRGVCVKRIFHWNGEESVDGKLDMVKVKMAEREPYETVLPVEFCDGSVPYMWSLCTVRPFCPVCIIDLTQISSLEALHA